MRNNEQYTTSEPIEVVRLAAVRNAARNLYGAVLNANSPYREVGLAADMEMNGNPAPAAAEQKQKSTPNGPIKVPAIAMPERPEAVTPLPVQEDANTAAIRQAVDAAYEDAGMSNAFKEEANANV